MELVVQKSEYNDKIVQILEKPAYSKIRPELRFRSEYADYIQGVKLYVENKGLDIHFLQDSIHSNRTRKWEIANMPKLVDGEIFGIDIGLARENTAMGYEFRIKVELDDRLSDEVIYKIEHK